MDQDIWEESKWKDIDKENIGSYHWHEERICAKEGKGVPIVKGRKRGDAQIHQGATEKRVY